MLDEGQIIQDSSAAEQYFLIEVIGLEFGRGLQCYASNGANYQREQKPNWGTHCAGEPYVRLADGSYQEEYGLWNSPCYKKDEQKDGICTSDAECEGLRTCKPLPSNLDMNLVPSSLQGNRLVGQCAGMARDGPEGTCNPCQRHADERACWADKDTAGLDCYWVRGKCRNGSFRQVSPKQNGGYHACVDQGYVMEWGSSYRCEAVGALGLCGEEIAQKRCPQTCDACQYVKYEEVCDDGAWGLYGKLFGATVIVWVLVIFCLIFGIKITGIITYFTMTVPFIMIFALLFAGITLDGASEGARQYIGRWDFTVLTSNPIIWANAAGQTFFTLGIGFGILTAYSSYNARDSNTVANALHIAFFDTMVAFVAGEKGIAHWHMSSDYAFLDPLLTRPWSISEMGRILRLLHCWQFRLQAWRTL